MEGLNVSWLGGMPVNASWLDCGSTGGYWFTAGISTGGRYDSFVDSGITQDAGEFLFVVDGYSVDEGTVTAFSK